MRDALKEVKHAEAIGAISLGSGERRSLKRYKGVTVQQHLTDQQTCGCRETTVVYRESSFAWDILAFRRGLTYKLYSLCFRIEAIKADVEVRWE